MGSLPYPCACAPPPQWGEFERQGFASVLTALARIGSNVNQIARAMNAAVLKAEYRPGRVARPERPPAR
jgi:hypothetical protein